MKTTLRSGLVFSAFVSLLIPRCVGAQAVRPVPSPGPSDAGFVEFVGNFGEVFRLRSGERVDAAMHGPVEVINLYPPYRKDAPKDVLVPFRPQAADFAPEKFTPLELIQLAIIPRSADAFRSLDDLKKEKIRDLKAAGADFRLFEKPAFPAFRGQWPEGTFEVEVYSPYRLTQLYVATPAYLCILTAGLDAPRSTAIADYHGPLRYALATWLVPQDEAHPEAGPAKVLARGISLHPFSVGYVWGGWALIVALGLLLGGAGAKRGEGRLYGAGIALLFVPNAGIVLGGAAGLAAWPFAWFAHHLIVPAAVAVLAMPAVLALFKPRALTLSRTQVVAVAAWAVAAACAIGFAGIHYDWDDGDSSRYVFAVNALVAFGAYAVAAALIVILQFFDRRSRALAAAAVLTGLLSQTAKAQQGAYEAQARAELERAGRGPLDYERMAEDNLSRDRVLYKYQRVEIKGIWSPNMPDNDTNKVFGLLFDLQIAPTQSQRVREQVLPQWIRGPLGRLKDLGSLSVETRNNLSSAAEDAVQKLANQDVNEIVAHSWGTEIVYNAVLSGLIRPPRRLVVCGMPDGSFKKWQAFAEYTGTEVVVYLNEKDPAAGLGKAMEGVGIGGAAAWAGLHGDGTIHGKDALYIPAGGDLAGFERQWAEACAQRPSNNPCNPHGRVAAAVDFRKDYQYPSHDRIRYYEQMAKTDVLPAGAIDAMKRGDEDAEYPGSAMALKRTQKAEVVVEEERLFSLEVKRRAARLADDASLDSGAGGFFDGAAGSGRVAAGVVAGNQKALDDQREMAEMERRKRDLQREVNAARSVQIYWYLREAVGMACQAPERFDAQVAMGRVISVEADQDALRDNFEADLARRGAASMTLCEQDLMRRLIVAQGRVSTSIFRDWAAQSRAAHATERKSRESRDLSDWFRRLFSHGGDGSAAEAPSSERERPEREHPPRQDEDRDDLESEAHRRSLEEQKRAEERYNAIVHRLFFGDGDPDWDGRRAH